MDSDRLSGWKEIAAHLCRSVRAAQRWEHELGLPVKRVKTAAGHVVFASRSELDAWLVQQQSTIHTESVEPDDSAESIAPDRDVATPVVVVSPALVSQPHTRSRQSRIALTAGAALVVIALAAWAWWPRPGTVHSVTFVGKVLQARDVNGHVLWHHEFDDAVRGMFFTGFDDGPRVEGADLDGDGTTEWLVPIGFGEVRRGLSRSDAVAAFSESGRLRWIATVPSDVTVTCGGESVRGPWQLGAMSVHHGPGPKSVWVAFHHPVRWPAFAVEVTPDGTVTRRYVQSGWIKGILERDTSLGRQVEIAGVLNDRERASLVTIDPAAPMTALSAASPEFACDTPNAGEPLRAVLFPPHDVSAAYQHKYYLATNVMHHGEGVRVDLSGGSAVALLDAAGVVTDITFIDEYWLQHDALYRDGRIDHPSDSCPQLRMPGAVEAWDGRAWTTYPVRRVIPAVAPLRTP